MKFTLSALALAALLIPVHAAKAHSFGHEQQLAISSESSLLIKHTSIGDDDDGTTQIIVGPSFDLFLIDHLSVGAALALDYTAAGNADIMRFSVGPRVGYDLRITPRLSLWPRVGASVAYTSRSIEAIAGTELERNSTAVAINVFAPLMFHPVDHFFVGFGPFFDADLSGDPKTTVVGGRLTLGGWLWL